MTNGERALSPPIIVMHSCKVISIESIVLNTSYALDLHLTSSSLKTIDSFVIVV